MLYGAVHPRGRGERTITLAKFANADGSSPRARGTRAFLIFKPGLMRFIPAGAGNALAAARLNEIAAVHPRGRGERATRLAATSTPSGSSPRARGTPVCLGGVRGLVRFIPAGAGNALQRYTLRDGGTVHPRGRGERCTSSARTSSSDGSSPRARGTRCSNHAASINHRFIPAGAGNAVDEAGNCQTYTVHPRGRGERVSLILTALTTGGSSPRARGTQRRVGPEQGHLRFIPAGAGNATPSWASAASRAVHPRGRGERWAESALFS